MTKKERAAETLKRLKKAYKKTGPFLNWSTPLELLVATALSAQCTDERVNMVTKKLFKKYKTAGDYARASVKTLEKEVYSTGFYRNKAKNLKKMGAVIRDEFDGEVPVDFEQLQKIPGVAKKTAAIVMSKAFDTHESVAVDTHVERITQLIGITRETSIEDIRRDLNKTLEPKNYLLFNEYLITHGRAVCIARRPQCDRCVLLDICKNSKKFLTDIEKKKEI